MIVERGLNLFLGLYLRITFEKTKIKDPVDISLNSDKDKLLEKWANKIALSKQDLVVICLEMGVKDIEQEWERIREQI
ncbi:MAG: hypothetical protein PHX30_04240 [Candidatus Pacebacteria bacterium]|nr:hypothetical protein [Candidatus Paceibacterota bacterium]